jgi:hypothetical protein
MVFFEEKHFPRDFFTWLENLFHFEKSIIMLYVANHAKPTNWAVS